MFFSPYTLLEPESTSIDPLGFLRPSSSLTDGLFRQFTVLANHPCYQGLLCCLVLNLESKGIRLGAKDYSRQFRELEAFWGVLNAQAGEGVVNITKFDQMRRDPAGCSRKSVARVGLMARPGYGTLGHYSRPSVSWGLLDRKAVNLTEFGKRLGEAWLERSAGKFLDSLEAWSKGAAFDPDEQSDLIVAHALTSHPSPAEAKVWREIISAYCLLDPQTRALWERPLEQEFLGRTLGNTEPTVYAEFFPVVQEQYSGDPILTERIETARQFEILSALSQQVFEWEYVRRLDEVRGNLPNLAEVETRLAKTLIEGCRTYLARSTAKDSRQLFHRLAQANGYGEVAAIIVSHHGEHQRAKGTGIWLDAKDVQVGGRYKASGVLEQMQAMRNGEVEILALTPLRRREWHFGRCRRWFDHANGGDK
jgi:hypothetical protein